MTTQDARVRIKLTGAFAIHGPAGEDRTPRGRKACAIVAMLALSPDCKRSRAWLQDKLWSARAQEQGAASLRQSIHEARAALGEHRDLIAADKFAVSIDRTKCTVDLEDDPSAVASANEELLEGLDVGDEEFEDWLRAQRATFRERTATTKEPVTRNVPARESPDATTNRQPILVLSRAPADRTETSIIADSLIDSIAKTVVELGMAKVYDRRMQSETASGRAEDLDARDGLSLRTEFFDSEAQNLVRLALLQIPENSLAWSSTLHLSSKDARNIDDPRIKACVNLVVNVAIDQFSKISATRSDQSLASSLCHSGILHLFRLGKTNFDAADALFSRAFEIDPRGIYLAWRAYLRTFVLGERLYSCRQTLDEEAFHFMHHALELEPYNSYVAALSAHVHSMMRRSYVAAYELAERSIQLNPANPLGWGCLGTAKSYLGKSVEGMQHTLHARAIAGPAPYRYQLDSVSSIASLVAGDVNGAIVLAEACHALAPTFAPSLRYLSALYAHKGDHERSFEMVQKLQINEPDFSFDKLRDKAYPVAGLHRTPLIASLPKRLI
jgi:tetratricopeptide (TPR) repeat protein